jgi:hypothetical protein
MTRSITIAIAATMLVAASACDKKDDAQIKTTSTGETNVSASADSANARGHSMVRVVNAIVGGKDIMLKLDTQTLFDSVKSSSVTDYREVSATMAKFSATASAPAASAMSAERDQVLTDGNRYTVVYMSEDVSKNVLRVVKDEVIPDSGKARVRILHAAPGGPELDVVVAGAKDKLFSGIDFKSEAGYADVQPGTVTLELRAKDSPKVLLTIPKLDLKRGTATTLVITGATKLAYFMFTDTMIAATPAK